MPLFIVRRRFENGTDLDVDAAGHRSAACLPFYDGMRWLHTFWDAERSETTCVYEARTAEQLRAHARQASIPCDEIREVLDVPVGDFVRTSEPTPA